VRFFALAEAAFNSDNIYHKNEKSKPCKMDLPLLKNDITQILWT
jgi:hypothetical protein